MKNFKKISDYITKNRVKLSIDSNLLKSQFAVTKEDKLLNGIVTGRYSNDHEAALDIGYVDEKDKAFKMLKSRIKDRLISQFFQINIHKVASTSYSSSLILAHKYLTAGQLLFNYGLSVEGLDLVKKGLSIARRTQSSGLILFACRLLSSRASFTGTRKEQEFYNKLLNENLPIYEAELESDAMRDSISMDYRESFSPHKKEKITRYWLRINELRDKYDNHVLKINWGRIGSKYHETIGDFKGIIRCCDEVESYLLNNPKFYELTRHREFANTKLEACLFLKDYELGQQCADTCMKLHSNFSINAVIVLEYYVLLCMHSGNFTKAWELFDLALSMPAFKNYTQERLEKWKLFEAFLTFVYPRPDRKFKLFKYLNEITVYSKDKRGINVAIMISQIILLLDEGRFDLLIDKADSFKIYFKRYVTKHINYRTFYFVKMLEMMFKYNFNYEKTKLTSNKFFNRLSDKAGHYNGDVESLEVIPYEELWQQVLLKLQKNKHTFVDPGKIIVTRTRKKKNTSTLN